MEDITIISMPTKTPDGDFEVIYNVDFFANEKHTDNRKREIEQEIIEIEEYQSQVEKRIDELNSEIDRLTNKADNFDYILSVASGVACGFIDSLYVGEFDFADLKADANRHVNKSIERYANLRGYKDNGRGLKGAIEFLEKKFPVDQDNVWKGKGISSTKLHHLEDFAHHPTLGGLFFSILVSFFRFAVFSNRNGDINVLFVETDKKKIVQILAPIIISGVMSWLVYVAESNYVEKHDKELPKPLHKLIVILSQSPIIIKLLNDIDNWFGHLVSDMGGSKNTSGGGMGIPGVFLSLMKEISSLPYLKDTSLPSDVSNWYSKEKFDMRSEMAIVEYLGKQSLPVIINECIVRTFYFVRHLLKEIDEKKKWENIDWNNVRPWKNRTVVRMITISSGTFMACDIADAAVRSAIKNGCNIYNPKLYVDFLLRINFVGIGRFAIAIGTDIKMGIDRENDISEKLALKNCSLMCDCAKVFFIQEGVWIEAKNTAEAIIQLQNTAFKSILFYCKEIKLIDEEWYKFTINTINIKENNPEFAEELLKLLN